LQIVDTLIKKSKVDKVNQDNFMFSDLKKINFYNGVTTPYKK